MKFMFAALAATLLAATSAAAECVFPAEDVAAVKAASDEYVAAWRANDVEGVARLLADNAVMMPHHGVEPVVGKVAALAWWFPEGKVTAAITRYETETQDVTGCGDMAVARGRLVILEYSYQGQTFRNRNGNWLTVFARQADGRWLIAQRIWNDPVAEVD